MEPTEPEVVEAPLPDDIANGSPEDIHTRVRLIDNELRVMKSERSRLNHERNKMNEQIKDNTDKIKNNKQLPYLVANVLEILNIDPDADEAADGASLDTDSQVKGKCAVIKTSTRQSIFLPLVGLVPADTLKPGDLIGVNKDSYLILDNLPAEYDSRVKAMEVDEKPTDQYTDIGGLDKQIEELVEAIVLPMQQAEKFKSLGIKAPKGALMYGPPGTGKTLLARACAAQTDACYLKLAGSSLVQMYIGDGARLVRDAFELARTKAPAIIFIDEIDAIGTKRFDSEKSGDREVQRTMLELLNQLDGFGSDDRIKVIAATNRIDTLDPALLRSGRLDRKIEFPLPNEEARGRIMEIHSRKMQVSKKVNYGELARSTDEFNGAQLKAVCVEAGMIALREGSKVIGHEHFLSGVLEVQSKKKNDQTVIMSGTAAANLLNAAFDHNLDWPIIEYITSLFNETDGDLDDHPVDLFVRPLLETEGLADHEIQGICSELQTIWDKQTGTSHASGPAKLDRALDMRAAEMLSKKQAITQVVDIASVVKARDTQVNLKALEKAEAKIRAKMEKRDRKNAYEGSKLMDAHKAQKSYEELFLEVNPLQLASQNKGKSKDIHLENIDVNFGSLRILSNATVTLAEGRRYGLIGRNGIGKSTLLRAMALREVNVPQHITILYVQQEVIGDDTIALESVLQADVHRTRLMAEEAELNAQLQAIEDEDQKEKDSGTALAEDSPERKKRERKRDEITNHLGDVQRTLVEIDADSGPARAAELLHGLGFDTADQERPTKSFSGGWRMRLSLARALFCKPDLLLLDEPSNNLDLNALAWLEDYLQTWPHTLLVVSHDRAFLNAVATDIIYQHNERLDYYKGNFTQFYATKEERRKQQQREYESQLAYRQHLQAFIDRWRYNANRAAQAQMKIKILEKLPELEPPEADDVVKFKFQETDKISPPLLQLTDASFGYDKSRVIIGGVNIDIGLDSRLGIIGPNGAGKSTMMKLLIGELQPTSGQQNRNGRLRIAYFAQHHIDTLDLTVNSVAYLARLFPGQTEQEYRRHLGAFGITGMTSLQLIGTLSGGQKSRVSFAILSLQRPHILLLDEPTNHLDIEGLDALMAALKVWNGGVIVISHDSTFLHTVCEELWVVADQKVEKFYGDVTEYKKIIVGTRKDKPT